MTGARAPWDGMAMGTGTVAVIGLGKIGLAIAARCAEAGWSVIGVDVMRTYVRMLAAGTVPRDDEPGVAERIAAAHADGRFTATTDHAAAAAQADVVIVIVPLVLTPDSTPDRRAIDAATEALLPGLQPGTLVIYETTLPIGDTRGRFAPVLAPSGAMVAYSPERVSSGRILRDLETYPKLVSGLDEATTAKASAFYESAFGATVRAMSSPEAAEFAKLAETTYRNVNIGLANEFARVAERAGVDILEVIDAANSQPYSHVHQPGLGIGGHCIPVYPHFLLDGDDNSLAIVRAALAVNDAVVERIAEEVSAIEGGLRLADVVVLGLTYRHGVKETAYSPGVAMVDAFLGRGARVWAYDPLLEPAEIARHGVEPYAWGTTSNATVVVTQTSDPLWSSLDVAWFPALGVFVDGRNSLRALPLRAGVRYLGIGMGERR